MQASAASDVERLISDRLDLSPRRPRADRLRRFVRKKPLGAISAAVLVALIMVALFAPMIAPYDPVKSQDSSRRLQPPSRQYLMGTDNLGRDIFSRVLYGA